MIRGRIHELYQRGDRGGSAQWALRPRPDPLSPRAQRLSAHRPCQGDLHRFRHWPRPLAASATCATTTPIPVKEDTEYVDAIKEDIHWLGYDWEDREYYASDYFEQLYQCAVKLIKKGKAYVDDLSADEIREYRGTLTEPGKESPYRNRSVEENLDLFERMRRASFPKARACCAPRSTWPRRNINLRDPVMYRILHANHHRTGDKWCIYPMYDYAHGQSDSIEGVTYSLCDIEYEDPPPAVRMVPRRAGDFHAAADRVCPPGPHLYHPQQALSQAAGRKGARARLGRPAHAHALRAAPARLPARGDPRFHRPGRRGQERRTSSISRCWSTACARTSTRPPCASWACSTRSRW